MQSAAFWTHYEAWFFLAQQSYGYYGKQSVHLIKDIGDNFIPRGLRRIHLDVWTTIVIDSRKITRIPVDIGQRECKSMAGINVNSR